jgi:UDP-glucose 4-epimerase
MTSAQPVVLVTGADGFVGRFMVSALARAGWRVRRAIRSSSSFAPSEDVFCGLELTPSTRWSEALEGVQAVVHTAARAHFPARLQQRQRDLYWSVNVESTRHLAQSAADAGVKRFVFLSSIAVNGSNTDGRAPFSETDAVAPDTIYGKSKAAAEDFLRGISANSSMRVTSVRPPMIYGRGARGNFRRLLTALNAGVPLPFALVENRRAFIGIDNLTSFVTHRLGDDTASKSDVFIVADDERVSTPEFLRMLARAHGLNARLLPFPVSMLRFALDRSRLSDALLKSLELDTSRAKATGWEPALTMAEGLRRAAQPDHGKP